MRVAGYARVSTQEQKLHGVSVAAQEQALADWAAEHGHEYVGCYNDAGISARSRYTKRPELLRLLQDVRRTGWSSSSSPSWIAGSATWGTTMRSSGCWTTAAWPGRPSGRTTRRRPPPADWKVNIMLSVAQDEADRTSERLKQTNAYRWAAGEVVQKLPAGYRREGKTVVVDEKMQPAVAAFFHTYLNTGSVAAAMDAANLLGLHMTRVGASKMLRNPFFTGTVRGISVPAYLTEEEFEQIQRRKATFVRTAKHNKTYLFSGLLVCGNCGAILHAQSNRSTVYYVRPLPEPERLLQRGPGLRQRAQAGAVAAGSPRIPAGAGDTGGQGGGQSGRKNDISRQNALTQRLERIKLLFINGDIDLPEYQTRKEEVEQQLQALRPRPRTRAERLDGLLPEGWKDVYTGLSREGRRAFWLRTVQRVVIHPDRHPEIVF